MTHRTHLSKLQTCAECGRQERGGGWTVTCSPECRYRRFRNSDAYRRAQSAYQDKKRTLPRNPCRVCGVLVRGSPYERPVCKRHGGNKLIRTIQRRRAGAERRLAKAARGTAGATLWAAGIVGIQPQQIAPRDCPWCGTTYDPQDPRMDYCTRTCRVRAKRVRRRGRSVDGGYTYTWTEVMLVFLQLDRCCAYCQQPVAGSPDPDHVIPLSRGGFNSIGNILPSCRLCNSDKRDLLLHEWADDRARRGKAPVHTDLDHRHLGFAHLSPLVFQQVWPPPG